MANAKKNNTGVTAKKEIVKAGATYTFGGEYYCREDKGLISKTYELAVTFPELLKAPLAVFKRGVSETGHPIRNLMIKKYPDYTAVRTYNVIGLENNTSSKPVKTNDISVMDIEQLKNYIVENDLGIDVEIYNNQINKVREAITLAQEDPEKFESVYAEDVEEYEYKKQLEDLNKDSDGNGEADGEGNKSDVDDLLDDLDGNGETDGDENGTDE